MLLGVFFVFFLFFFSYPAFAVGSQKSKGDKYHERVEGFTRREVGMEKCWEEVLGDGGGGK